MELVFKIAEFFVMLEYVVVRYYTNIVSISNNLAIDIKENLT